MASTCPDETVRMRGMNLNLCILRMQEDTFSLGATRLILSIYCESAVYLDTYYTRKSHKHTHACTHARIHTYIHTCTHTHTHARTHIHKHANTHTHTHKLKRRHAHRQADRQTDTHTHKKLNFCKLQNFMQKMKLSLQNFIQNLCILHIIFTLSIRTT